MRLGPNAGVMYRLADCMCGCGVYLAFECNQGGIYAAISTFYVVQPELKHDRLLGACRGPVSERFASFAACMSYDTLP